MAKLPSAEDLGLPPNAISGRPIATYDVSAEAEGAAKLAQGAQALGNSLVGLGEHFDRIAEKHAAFDSKVQRSGLDTDIETFLQDKNRSIPADGRGYVDDALKGIDELAQKRLGAMSGQSAEQYKKAWEVERESVRNKLAATAVKQQDTYQTDVLDKEQNKVLNTLLADPSQGMSLIEQQAAFERDSMLRPEVRTARETAWRTRAEEFLAERLGGRDEKKMTAMLGAAPRPSAAATPAAPVSITDISGTSTYSRQSEPLTDVKGLVIHHTAMTGSASDIVSTLNGKGLGVQYVIDREGKVFQTLPEGARGAHTLKSRVTDLSNDNSIGVEVIAKDDSDVTPAQVKAASGLAAQLKQKYPNIKVVGHGEIDGVATGGQKQDTEGTTIARAIRGGAAPSAVVVSPNSASIPQGAAVQVGSNVSGVIQAAAKKYDVPLDYMLKTANIESRFNPNADNGNAQGMYQFIPSTWRKYGNGASVFDAGANADAAARLYNDNKATLTAKLGRAPTPGEVYLAHQQGPGDGTTGASGLLLNPTAPAASVVGMRALLANGGTPDMTAQQFAQKWVGKIDGGAPIQVATVPAEFSNIPPERRLALIQRARSQQQQDLADQSRLALNTAETYERQILDYSAGRGPLPTRASVEADPQLDLSRRNAVLRQLDSAVGAAVSDARGGIVAAYNRNLADAQGTGSPLVERTTIEKDPRLTEDQRNTLLKGRDQTALHIENRTREAIEKDTTRAAGAAHDQITRNLIEAARGAEPLVPREFIENSSLLKEPQRNELLKARDKAAESAGALAAATARLTSGQLNGTGFAKGTQDDVNAIVNADVASPAVLFEGGGKGTELRARVTEIARQTGAVPTVAVEMIRSGFASPDPARVEKAAQFGSQIMGANPNAFATAPGKQEIQDNVRAFDFYVSTLGMPTTEAATQISRQNDPEWRKKNRKTDDEINGFEKKLRENANVNDLGAHLAAFKFGPLAIGKPDIAFTKAGEGQLEADYILSARMKYAVHGDEELAKKQAMAELLGDPKTGTTGVYGVTNVTGRSVLMKYAPEAAPGYPSMPDGGRDYIGQQAIEHIKATDGKDVKAKDLSFVSMGRNTAEMFRRGEPVPYRLFYNDDRGVYHEVKPNSPIGWVADPAKARAAFEVKARADVDAAAMRAANTFVSPANQAKTPGEARDIVAEGDAARRAGIAGQEAARQPLIDADVARSRELAAASRQMPADEPAADIPRADFSGWSGAAKERRDALATEQQARDERRRQSQEAIERRIIRPKPKAQ